MYKKTYNTEEALQFILCPGSDSDLSDIGDIYIYIVTMMVKLKYPILYPCEMTMMKILTLKLIELTRIKEKMM